MAPGKLSMITHSASDSYRRRRMRLAFFLFLITAIATACSSLEPYRFTESSGEGGTIEDQQARIGKLSYMEVMSIDRKRIDSRSRGIDADSLDQNDRAPGNPDKWIPLRAGLRKLEVLVCRYKFPWGWSCGRSVLPLVVEPGTHYRLCGSVNKQEDHAELWIEDARSGKTVVDTVRVPVGDS